MFLALILKELKTEFRTPAVIAGIFLHLVGSIFILYLLVTYAHATPSSDTWNGFFWLLILFIQVHAVGKGFMGERKGLMHYYYYTVNPVQLILSRIVYNFLLAFVFSSLAFGALTFFVGSYVANYGTFWIVLLLSAWGFAGALTLPAAVASRSGNGPLIMSILSFPVVISVLLLSMKTAAVAIDASGVLSAQSDLLTLFGICCILTATSYILFPYIWRS